MNYLKKFSSHLMVPYLYRTNAIASTRLSTFPRNKVSDLVTRKCSNKAHPGPLRHLYQSHARSFRPLICAGGGVFRHLQKTQGTSRGDSLYQPPATTEEQIFWNSIMIYLKKVVHSTHVMVHRFYRTRAISSTTLPRFLALCAFGLISGIVFQQLRKIHSTVNLERADMTNITAIDPKFPIFCELRLYVKHNSTGHVPVTLYVHGFWKCYYDNNGILHHLINENPTKADEARAYEDLAQLDDCSLFDLKFIWPSFRGPDEKFWVKEFVKHALTSVGVYRDHYFRDVLSVSGPFLGGERDIAKFLEKNYLPGVQYTAIQLKRELSKHVGADVQIIGSNKTPVRLEEIGILFTRDGKVLLNHPKASLARGDFIVRVYLGESWLKRTAKSFYCRYDDAAAKKHKDFSWF